jgi:hypothetical protein
MLFKQLQKVSRRRFESRVCHIIFQTNIKIPGNQYFRAQEINPKLFRNNLQFNGTKSKKLCMKVIFAAKCIIISLAEPKEWQKANESSACEMQFRVIKF